MDRWSLGHHSFMADVPPSLTHFARLAILAAVVTIGLKTGAYLLTGSVGLLSDALESLVNLVAAVGALLALTVAAKEPDEEHAYGHAKAEYFSSGLEGGLIILAAGSIVVAAIPRLLRPEPIEQIGWGLAVSTLASLINLGVARRLFRFASVHVLVPGDWTVQRGHRLLEAIERDMRQALPGITVDTHLESLDDPASWDDTALDRPAASPSRR